MKGLNGHIYLETHADKPGQVRVLTQDEAPAHSLPDDPIQIRYIADFKNAHIAYMHVHNTLKKKLQDINTRFYAVSLPEAIAAVECEDLAHQRVWLDPSLSDSEITAIVTHTDAFKNSQNWVNRIYLMVGGVGLLLLAFIVIGGVWNV